VLLIALTGWGQPEDRRRADEAGLDHHLVKPVDSAMLVRSLARCRSDPARREAPGVEDGSGEWD
jgi:CheY-like chemotaxis protein